MRVQPGGYSFQPLQSRSWQSIKEEHGSESLDYCLSLTDGYREDMSTDEVVDALRDARSRYFKRAGVGAGVSLVALIASKMTEGGAAPVASIVSGIVGLCGALYAVDKGFDGIVLDDAATELEMLQSQPDSQQSTVV